MSSSPSPRAPRARPSPRALAALLGVWAVAAAGTLLVAGALDSPVGAGGRDEARPVVEGVIEAPGGDLAAGRADLPPLAPVLDRPPPDGIGRLPAREQVTRLLELASTRAEPRRLVELGVVYRQLGDTASARDAYRDALRLDPDDLAARMALAMADGADGPEGRDRAAAALRRLAVAHPESQLVAFNEGWLAIYRREAEAAGRAWRHAVQLAPDSRLGRTARTLLGALERRPSAAAP